MKCNCGGAIVVKDGRQIEEGYWRRRRCVLCSTEYTTIEQFCETVRGHRAAQPQYTIPKPAKVSATRSKEVAATVKAKRGRPPRDPSIVYPKRENVRNKVEDLRMQREVALADGRGWDE